MQISMPNLRTALFSALIYHLFVIIFPIYLFTRSCKYQPDSALIAVRRYWQGNMICGTFITTTYRGLSLLPIFRVNGNTILVEHATPWLEQKSLSTIEIAAIEFSYCTINWGIYGRKDRLIVGPIKSKTNWTTDRYGEFSPFVGLEVSRGAIPTRSVNMSITETTEDKSENLAKATLPSVMRDSRAS